MTISKSAIFLILLLGLSCGLVAQEIDTTFFEPQKRTSYQTDIFSFTYHFSRLTNLPNGPQTYSLRSSGLSFSFFLNQNFDSLGRFSVAEGIGLRTNNYFTNIGFWGSTPEIVPDSAFLKNKLAVVELQVPLEFRINGKPNERFKSFRAAMGIDVGLIISSRKTLVTAGNQLLKLGRTEDLLQMRRLRFDATARIIYGYLGISGSYSLIPLFYSNGFSTTPWNIGITYAVF